MFQLQEALLEPVARRLRFQTGLPFITKKRGFTLLDLGCGPHLNFNSYLQRLGYRPKQYIGVDPLISPSNKMVLEAQHKVNILTKKLIKTIPLSPNTFDYIVAFAFFEHIDHPHEIFRSALKLLKPGGALIMTAPTPFAKHILETLSFKLHLISRREIEEHKRYFTQKSLTALLPKQKSSLHAYHRYFELGLNNLYVVTKVR